MIPLLCLPPIGAPTNVVVEQFDDRRAIGIDRKLLSFALLVYSRVSRAVGSVYSMTENGFTISSVIELSQDQPSQSTKFKRTYQPRPFIRSSSHRFHSGTSASTGKGVYPIRLSRRRFANVGLHSRIISTQRCIKVRVVEENSRNR